MKTQFILLAGAFLSFQSITQAALIWHSDLNGNAIDTTPGARNGVAIGTPTATADRFGNANGAVLFNGSSAFDLGILSSTLNGATFAGWIKVSSFGGDRGIFGLGATGGGVNDQYFSTQLSSTGYRADVDDGDPPPGGTAHGRIPATYDQTPLATNVWQHFAVTFQAGGTLAIYINGIQVSSAPLTSNTLTNLKSFVIGSERLDSRFFTGAMDDVSIYDTALSASQIAALVPEPTSALLFSIAGLSAFTRRRRG